MKITKRILLASLFFYAYVSSGQDFIVRKGSKLKIGANGDEIFLRGIAFGNWVWSDIEIPNTHHQEIDYKRVKQMGMNTVRFYLNYKTFEDDLQPFQYKEKGWQWIDQNIEWAKKHGIYLILNIHVPQGGFQSQCKGDALWANQTNQERVAGLWKVIANRYKNETRIAGYELVNEPTPSGSIDKWKNLAQKIIDSIRTVDNHHLIIVERAIALGCDYGFVDENYNYPILKEENLMYTAHFYEPYLYTHQNLEWAGTGEGGIYPDENIITAPADAKFAVGNYRNLVLPTGTITWTYSKGKPFYVSADSLIFGRPVLYGHRLGTGMAYYDDITLNEVDAQGNVIKQLAKSSFNPKGTLYFWSEKNDGGLSTSLEGHGDNSAIINTGTTGFSSIILADITFKAEKGKYYAIDGWVKGTNLPVGATVSISTEFSYSPSNTPVQVRNYSLLKNLVLRSTKFPREQGYPVYIGEFGLARNCFENGRGGENWTRDLMHIFDSLDFHFTYHDYHEDGFGLYKGWNSIVDTTTINTPLKNTFAQFFLGIETGLDTDISKSKLLVYPNPTNTSFKIQNHLSMSNYKMFNVHGEVLKEGMFYEFGEDLNPGIYFLQWYNKDKSGVIKIVKR